MIFTSVKNIVRETRSYRTFDENRAIEYDTMLKFVDTARLCASAANRQPLKYKICSDRDTVENLLLCTKWAGFLENIKLPPDSKHPTGFIVICHDKSICEITNMSSIDVGIAAQTIMLCAAESGYGGCMIGAFDKNKISDLLSLADEYEPVLLLALGTPDETVIISNPKDNNVQYFRDNAGLHFVPKRQLKDVVIK